jgi:hypothetical protein
MIHQGAQRGTKDHTVLQSYTKPYPTIPFPNHTLYNREDPRQLVTASSTIMMVVHSIEVSTLYPCVVISSLIGRLQNLIFAILTLPLVYGPEITTCRYKGLLQELVMLCYSFPHLGTPLAMLRFPHNSSPSCTLWIKSRSAPFPTPPSKTHSLQRT